MKWMIVIASILLLAAPTYAQKGQVSQQKKELDKIKKDVQRGQQRLDSLKKEETRVRGELRANDERLQSQLDLLTKLNRELKSLSGTISTAQRQVLDRQAQYQSTQSNYLSNVRQLYKSIRTTDGAFVQPAREETDLNRRLVYLTSLASWQAGTVASAAKFVTESVNQLEKLSQEGSKVSAQKKKRERAVSAEKRNRQKREQALARLQNLSKSEADRVITLQKAAEEMQKILARLEQQSKQKEKVEQLPADLLPDGVFASLRGSFQPPVDGKVIVPYGSATHPVTKIKSFSPGVTFQSRAGSNVSCIAGGQVVYTGSLRGYGNFVIVQHDSEHYSTYAGLTLISVAEKQGVEAGSLIGTVGTDGVFKFELRQGKQSLNPEEWLNNELL